LFHEINLIKIVYSSEAAFSDHFNGRVFDVEIGLDAYFSKSFLPGFEYFFGPSPKLRILHIFDKFDAKGEFLGLVRFREVFVSDPTERDVSLDFLVVGVFEVHQIGPCKDEMSRFPFVALRTHFVEGIGI
jgi:hypothetical protein